MIRSFISYILIFNFIFINTWTYSYAQQPSPEAQAIYKELLEKTASAGYTPTIDPNWTSKELDEFQKLEFTEKDEAFLKNLQTLEQSLNTRTGSDVSPNFRRDGSGNELAEFCYQVNREQISTSKVIQTGSYWAQCKDYCKMAGRSFKSIFSTRRPLCASVSLVLAEYFGFLGSVIAMPIILAYINTNPCDNWNRVFLSQCFIHPSFAGMLPRFVNMTCGSGCPDDYYPDPTSASTAQTASTCADMYCQDSGNGNISGAQNSLSGDNPVVGVAPLIAWVGFNALLLAYAMGDACKKAPTESENAIAVSEKKRISDTLSHYRQELVTQNLIIPNLNQILDYFEAKIKNEIALVVQVQNVQNSPEEIELQ